MKLLLQLQLDATENRSDGNSESDSVLAIYRPSLTETGRGSSSSSCGSHGNQVVKKKPKKLGPVSRAKKCIDQAIRANASVIVSRSMSAARQKATNLSKILAAALNAVDELSSDDNASDDELDGGV